ncbi:hypothetical protein [Bacteroides oleiciplenus]|uniref:Uncharacterized protein n=1 Tax=Bacteroides oleiciplenus TaxID=626931 RepID=A0A3E5BSR2_9BACE|nr:hypothetical protein [Bacteroides oleiciplenus]RGN40415.1 hypothetical protein DXB65_01960 [Bacteroides oleiciplenus]
MKKWSLKLVAGIKVIHLFMFYVVLTAFIAIEFKPYLRTISQGEFSAVQWMVNPIIVLTALIYWAKIKMLSFNFLVLWIKKISLCLYRDCGRLFALLFNVIVLELFILLTVLNNFILIYGWHLYLCNLRVGMILVIGGILLEIIFISFFTLIRGDFLFLQTSEFE